MKRVGLALTCLSLFNGSFLFTVRVTPGQGVASKSSLAASAITIWSFYPGRNIGSLLFKVFEFEIHEADGVPVLGPLLLQCFINAN